MRRRGIWGINWRENKEWKGGGMFEGREWFDRTWRRREERYLGCRYTAQVMRGVGNG